MVLHREDASPLDKTYWFVNLLIRLSVVVALFGAFVEGNWAIMFLSVLVFLLTFLPGFIERNYSVHLPVEFELALVLFIYASLFLGNVHGYYTRFWWWDIALHAGSGIVLGIVGFLIMYALDEGGKIDTSPVLLVTFAFAFAVAIGAVWEIFEFAMDTLFGYSMQHGSLVDTMWDLIVDCLGALLVSVLGWFYLKGDSKLWFDTAIRRFVRENPRLFK